MPMLTAQESLAKNGPCLVADAHGDILPGSISAINIETGDYVVACIDDSGFIVSQDGWIKYERCHATPPLRLIPMRSPPDAL